MGKQEDFFSVEDEKDEYSMVLDQMFKKEETPETGNSSSEQVPSEPKESKKKEKSTSSKKKGRIAAALTDASEESVKCTILLNKKEAVTLGILSGISKKSVSSLLRRAVEVFYASYFDDTERYSDMLKYYDLSKIDFGDDE